MSEREQTAIFSNNLNRLLREREKSQKEVADAIGVSPQTFNTWCKGIALPRMGKIQRLADYFMVNKSALLELPSIAASSTAAPVSMDPRKNAIDHYYPNLSDESKDELLKRCVELVKLDSMNAGSAEVPRRSLDYDDSESIA